MMNRLKAAFAAAEILAEAANPATPVPRLERIAREHPIAAIVAAYPEYLHARAMWLRQYALKVTPRPEHDAAQDFYVLPQTLTQLAQRPEWFTRRYVTLNPTTPLDMLAMLANDTVPEVAEAVTLHPKATPALIWYIYGRLVTGDIPTRNVFYRMVAFASPFLDTPTVGGTCRSSRLGRTSRHRAQSAHT